MTVTVRQMPLGTATTDALGVWRLRPERDLEGGPQVLVARASDRAGNLGPAGDPWTLTILSDPPEAPVIEGPRLTQDGTPEIFGFSPPAMQVVVWEGEVRLGSTVSDAQGRWVLASEVLLEDGGHLVEAEVINGFGVRSPRSGSWLMFIQRAGMAVPTVSFQSEATGVPVVRGTLDARETHELTVSVGGRIYRSSSGSVSIDRSTGRWSLPIPPEHRLVAGVYPVEATASDRFGNSATDPTSDELRVGVPGVAPKPSVPYPVSSDGLTFMVGDRDPLDIDLAPLFIDPFGRPLRFALVGVDNVTAGLEGSRLRLEFGRTFNSQATIRIQVISDPDDPTANPVYAITVIYDADKDAIPDEVEDTVRDLNRDGIDDAYQNAVATFPMRSFGLGTSAPTNDFVSMIVGDYEPTNRLADGFGVVVDTPARFNQVEVREVSELGEPPAGLTEISKIIHFKVTSPTPRPDGSIVVTLVLYQPNNADVVYKFGRRNPADPEPGFYEFNWDGRTGGQFIDTNGDGRADLLRLVYRDGERGDDDGRVNGVLVDPVFVAKRDAVPPQVPVWTTPSGRVSTPRPPLAGTAEPFTMVRVYSGNEPIGLVRADELGRWALRPTQDLPDGRFLFEATATDASGNVSPRSRSLELWVQTRVVATDDLLPRVPGKPLKIPVAQLLGNDLVRLGSPRVNQVDARSARGGTLVLDRGWIIYTPPAGLADEAIDSFAYTVSDGNESAQARVHLIGEPWRVGTAKSLIRVIPLTVGVGLRFSVIPAQRYLVSASDRLGSGEDWKPIGTAWSDDLGRLEIRDADGLGATRFYRVEALP